MAIPSARSDQPAASQIRRPPDSNRSQQANPATAAPSMAASGWKARPYRIVIGKTAKAPTAINAARRHPLRRINSKSPQAATVVAIAERARPDSSRLKP